MTARDADYPTAPGYELRVPTEIWAGALRTLGHYGRLDSEGLVYLAGVRAADDVALVSGLYSLGHTAQGGTVVVEPEEARWLLRTLRARDEKLLAQVHSHPGVAFHSPGDDARATSFHRGFLSIVVPGFARGVSEVSECAVYEFDGLKFTELDPAAVAARIKVCDKQVERRPLPAVESRWQKLWKRFRARLS
jgi:hypothetical protein